MRRFFGRVLLLAALTFGLVGGIAKHSEPADNTERTTPAVTPPPPLRTPPQGPKAKSESSASDTIVLLGALFLAGSDMNATATLIDQARKGRGD